jgi:hypothetical protein
MRSLSACGHVRSGYSLPFAVTRRKRDSLFILQVCSLVLWFTREQLRLVQSTSPTRTSANLTGPCVKGTAPMRAAPNAAAHRLGLVNKDVAQTVQMGI